jgi:dTDP-4-amino-4,6-dideoxygalactose transaminase
LNNPEVKFDLKIEFGNIYGKEEENAALECIRQNAPSCGKKVKEFEDGFSDYCGVKYGIAVTSATTGLKLAGIAAGIQTGDEVITTPVSWIASASAFSELGARIVFCDIEADSLNMDPAKLESLITPRTKAIVPVHLFGQCCRMDMIMDIAKKYNITVIEDCAHCPGAEYKGKKSGAMGDMGVFSFHQQKNISTLGEGGMVITDREDLFRKILSYRSLCCRTYGGNNKYLPIDEEKYPEGKQYWKLMFDDIGFNYRMTDIQAAVGLEQLKKLEHFNKKRIEIAEKITKELRGLPGLKLPCQAFNSKHIYHLYMIQIEKEFPLSKEDFMWEMYMTYGIKVWSNYMLIHLTDPYRVQGHGEGECPVAEEAFNKYVSLPIHPRMTDESINYMITCIKKLAKN